MEDRDLVTRLEREAGERPSRRSSCRRSCRSSSPDPIPGRRYGSWVDRRPELDVPMTSLERHQASPRRQEDGRLVAAHGSAPGRKDGSMDLAPHLEAVRGDGSSRSARTTRSRPRWSAWPGRSRRRSISSFRRPGDAALELTEQLSGGHAEVRVLREGRASRSMSARPNTLFSTQDDDGTTARVTLRMPDALTATLEEAAETIGVSVNALLVQSAQTAVGRMTEEKRTPGRGMGSQGTPTAWRNAMESTTPQERSPLSCRSRTATWRSMPPTPSGPRSRSPATKVDAPKGLL